MLKKMIGIILLATLFLTGCSTVNLNEKDSELVAEYMAVMLLNHDKNYDDKLLEPTPTKEPVATKEPLETKNPINEPENDGKPVAGANNNSSKDDEKNEVSWNSLMAVKNITVVYKNYKIVDSYSAGNNSVVIDSQNGNKLLVVHFDVVNNSKKDIKYSLLEKQIIYLLKVNGKTIGQPKLTILNEDLQFMNETINANESSKALLIFEIDQKLELKDVCIEASKGKDTASIILK